MNFKKLAVVTLSSSILVTPYVVNEASAAETVQEITFKDGDLTFTVPYSEFATAVALESGEFYEYYNENTPDIVSVSVEEGTFVDYTTFATRIVFEPDRDPVEFLQELSNDPEVVIPQEEEDTYSTYQGISENGQVIVDNEVVPKVISIE